MAIIYLYESTEEDFSYNGQPLPEAYDVVVDYEINESYFVTFKHPLDKDETYKQIKKDMIVTVHTPNGMQPKRIMDVNKGMDEVEFEAWPLFYADMRTKLVRPLTLRHATGHVAFTQFVNNLVSDTPFVFSTNITDTHDYHTQSQQDRESNPNELFDALEVFKDLVARWDGEVIINGYDIRVVDRIGEDKEALLYEKKNIASFLDKESIQDVVTRLYGEAHWTEEVEGGDSIEHSISTVVDSPLIDAYSGVVFEKQYTNNDVRSEEELKRWLNLKFSTENIDKPKRNLEVGTNIIDGEEIHAGDGLVLKYLKHDVDAQMRVIGYQYDGYNDEYISVSIGNASESFTGSVQNNISNLENNVSNKINMQADVILNGLGQKIIFSEQEPEGNFKNGDTWFDQAGNVWMWNEERARWETHPTKDVVDQALREAQEQIEEAQATADNAANEIEIAVENAGFTTLDETISSVQSISNAAQASADVARDHALDALSGANTAMTDARSALNGIDQLESTVSDINFDIDEINGTLDLKADSQTVDALDGTVTDLSTDVSIIAGELSAKADSSVVDTLSGIVDNHTLDIQANAEGLALKANQDTVDTLAGTVQSLGTEFDIVAGQVNSRVWNTDIETAIDGIEVGGRNLLENSNDFSNFLPYSGSTITYETGSSIEQAGINDGTRLILSRGSTTILTTPSLSINSDYKGLLTYSFWAKNNGNESIRFRVNGFLPLSGSSLGQERLLEPGETEKFIFHGRMRDDYDWFQHQIRRTEDGQVVDVTLAHRMLEKGTIATDWTEAPEDTLARFDHIETEWTQTFDSFEQTVSSIDGRVSKQEQTVSGMESVVYDPETGLSSLNTQLADLIQVAVTGEEMTGAISVLENNINARVEKGDVINQINISDENILIQANKIMALGDVVVDGKLTITDEFIAPNAQIDGAKIRDATIGSAKIASLDVNKVSGNTSNFVQSAWNNAAGGDVRITGSGILTTASDNSQTYVQNGIIGTRNPNGATIGQIGYIDDSGSPSYTISTTWGSHFKVKQYRSGRLRDSLTLESGGYNGGIGTNRFEFTGNQGVHFYNQLTLQNGLNANGYNIYGVYDVRLDYGGYLRTIANGPTRLSSSGAMLQLGVSGRWKLNIDATYLYAHVNLSMEGNDITNQSDERLKYNIKDVAINSLEEIKAMHFVEFDRTNGNHDEIGVIAQNTPSLALYDTNRDVWSINSSKQIMMNSHAIQQIGFKQDEIETVVNAHSDIIHELQSELSKANRKIEELERKIG